MLRRLLLPFAGVLLLSLLAACGANGGTNNNTDAAAAALPTLAVLASPTPVLQTATPLPIERTATAAALVPSASPSPLPEVVGVPTVTGSEDCQGSFIALLEAETPVGTSYGRGDSPHLYRFDGQAGAYLWLEVTRLSGDMDPYVTLCAPQGVPLAVDDNSAGMPNALLRNVPLPQDGQYSVQVRGGSLPGNYRVLLRTAAEPFPVTPIAQTLALPAVPLPEQPTPTLVRAARGTPLTPFVPVVGSIADPGDIFQHSLFAEAGAVITIGIAPQPAPQPGASLLPRAEVFGPSGELVASATWQDATTGGRALIPLLPVSSTGAYIVIVSGDEGSAGDYSIGYGVGAAYADVQRGAALEGQFYTVDDLPRGLRDVWTLALAAGDEIIVSLTANSATFDPVLELARQDSGDLLAVDDNSGGGRNPLLAGVRIPAAGQYLLRVNAAGASSSGGYTLIWRYARQSPTPTIPPGRVLLFTVDAAAPDGDYVFYPFQGRAGQVVEVRVTGQLGFDPVAALVDPDGAVLAEADDSAGSLNPLLQATLPADGTYRVRINGYGLAGGVFTLEVDEVVDTTAP